jgi:uncharacterized protein (AIM24 family)
MLLLLVLLTTNIFLPGDGSVDVTAGFVTTASTVVHDGKTFYVSMRTPGYVVWETGGPTVNVTVLELQRRLREVEGQVCLVRPVPKPRQLIHVRQEDIR